MTFIISHPEKNSIEIPFVKKNETELPKKKLIFFNTTTQNNEDFTFYDYVGHPEKIGYEWSKGGFKYKITIKDNKIIKKLTLEKQQRIDFNIDESRIFNITPANGSFFNILILFLMVYIENVDFLKKHFKISGKKFDFTRLSLLKKHLYLSYYSTFQHKNKPYIRRFDDLYSIYFRPYTIILKDSNILIKVFKNRIQRLLVPRFFHDRRQTNFLKDLIFIGEKTIEPHFSKFRLIGRKLYEYRAPPNENISEHRLQEIDLPFPEKYIEDFTFTGSGF